MKSKRAKNNQKDNIVKVIVGERAYQMTQEQADGLVNIGRQSVHNGVYAAKKRGMVILLNLSDISRERYRELCREYNKQGFVLYHNRGGA